MSTWVFWTETMIELPEVREGGMSGRNEQRKPGTARGSPMRSSTAKASRISRHAAKSRCACERDGWGRLSDDGPRQHNSNPSEDPWGGGVIPPQGGAQWGARPDTVGGQPLWLRGARRADANWMTDSVCREKA